LDEPRQLLPRDAHPFQEFIMPKFIIERNIPGAGEKSLAEWRPVARKSCGVLRELGPEVQWLQSYVTDDKLYCVYIAPDEAAVREHARRGGIPADRVSRIGEVIDPTTAEIPASES